jgi:hypothetical protein
MSNFIPPHPVRDEENKVPGGAACTQVKKQVSDRTWTGL